MYLPKLLRKWVIEMFSYYLGFAKGPTGYSFGTNIKPNMTGDFSTPTHTVITPQMARLAKRIYVGNIPYNVAELDLSNFFNSLMAEKKLATSSSDSVVGIQLFVEKNFAFLEMRSAEEASAAMELDGVEYENNILKVRRPRNFQVLAGQAECIGNQMQLLTAIVAADDPTRVLISGIPTYLKEEQIEELLTPFGTVISITLVKDPVSGQFKGQAFCEFESVQVAEMILEGLAGMEIGDSSLSLKSAIQVMDDENLGFNYYKMSMPNLLSREEIITGASASLGEASVILLLYNLVQTSDLLNDEIFENLELDVKEECSKYGKVESVIIPRPVPGQLSFGLAKVI
jgi:splicing factor U2AF subunit